MTFVYWVTSLAALLGVLLNIRKQVAAFWIWSVTNAVWTYADLTYGLYPQAALMAAYFALSIYGIWSWSRKEGGLDGEEASP
jgi:nicotinamide riboside transporter PnuC